MADMLQTGATWAAAQRKLHAASTVTYRRGARTVSLAATRGRSVHDLQESNGSTLRVQSDDFIITAADLVIGGQPTEPQRGDLVIVGDETFEVVPFAPDPCFRKSDPHGVSIRIHTKLKGGSTKL